MSRRKKGFCRRKKWLIGIAASFAVWPLVAAPASLVSSPPAVSEMVAPNDSLPLLQDPTLRLTLPVMVDGHGPYDFLVDTGSDRSLISRELAATLALRPGARVVIHESEGSDRVSTVIIDHLTVGSRTLDHVVAPALAAKDIGAAGMLGVDALRDLHLVMDFKTMRLTSAPSQAEPRDDHTIVVQGRSRYGQLILANSRIHGRPILVVLDSGAEVTVGNPALLRLLTGHGVSERPTKTTTLVTVTGRKATVELDVIAEAQVGGVLIRNMPLAFAQLSIFDRFGLTRQPALLLGMDVLSLCRKVTVDLRRHEATFTLND
jgi:predicted aspartyl protease